MVSAGRFVFAWLALAPVVLLGCGPVFEGRGGGFMSAVRCFGWATVTCVFTAAALMPLADATAISFLNPLIAMVLAIPGSLGSVLAPWRWGCGDRRHRAAVPIRPGMEAFQPAALIALAAALFGAVEVIFIKLLTGGQDAAGEPAIRILFINNTIGAVVALAAASTVWVWPSPSSGECWPASAR